MSVNNLLNDSGNKGWANLFVNSVTIYNNLTVLGNSVQEGNLTVNADLEILGDLLNSASGSNALFYDMLIENEFQFINASRISIVGQEAADQLIQGNEGYTYAYEATSGFADNANFTGSVEFHEVGGQVAAHVRFNIDEEPTEASGRAELEMEPVAAIPARFLPREEVTCVAFLTIGNNGNPLLRNLYTCMMSVTSTGIVQFRLISNGNSAADAAGEFTASTIYSSEGRIPISYISAVINP